MLGVGGLPRYSLVLIHHSWYGQPQGHRASDDLPDPEGGHALTKQSTILQYGSGTFYVPDSTVGTGDSERSKRDESLSLSWELTCSWGTENKQMCI